MDARLVLTEYGFLCILHARHPTQNHPATIRRLQRLRCVKVKSLVEQVPVVIQISVIQRSRSRVKVSELVRGKGVQREIVRIVTPLRTVEQDGGAVDQKEVGAFDHLACFGLCERADQIPVLRIRGGEQHDCALAGALLCADYHPVFATGMKDFGIAEMFGVAVRGREHRAGFEKMLSVCADGQTLTAAALTVLLDVAGVEQMERIVDDQRTARIDALCVVGLVGKQGAAVKCPVRQIG